MPVNLRNAAGVSPSSISPISHTVMIGASLLNHKMRDDRQNGLLHNVSMSDEPNNLRAWRTYRKLTQAQLAEAIGTTPHMISYLETGQRGLSLKWLLRLAPALSTTPDFLLDHDPADLPSDVMEIWGNANERQKRQIVEIARTLLATGTND